MEEIQQRLKDAADQSSALAAWATNKQNAEARESLLEAVHELRKVSARLEIEIAASEREDSSGRSLPIPSLVHTNAAAHKRIWVINHLRHQMTKRNRMWVTKVNKPHVQARHAVNSVVRLVVRRKANNKSN